MIHWSRRPRGISAFNVALVNRIQPFRSYLARLPIYHDMQNNFNYNRNGFRCLRPIEFRGQPLLQVPITAFGCDEKLSTCPTNCRCWVRTVDQAVKVNCANQTLTRLPDSIPDGGIELDVSNNELGELPDVPDYVRFLQVLDLSGNHLHQLNENIFKAQHNISVIRLKNNELMALPRTVSDKYQQI